MQVVVERLTRPKDGYGGNSQVMARNAQQRCVSA